MTIEVAIADRGDEDAWEAFVANHPDATFFHRFAWSRVLLRAFGHRPHYLIARRGSACCGVLPLSEVRSKLFGRRLSSLPFCVYGGVLAGDPEAENALRGRAKELAESLQVDFLELRSRDSSTSGWPVKDLYFTFRKVLSDEHEQNLKSIPNRQRAMLRKGLKEGLFSEETRSVDRIFRVYSESVRNLGTPVFSKRYFKILLEEFGEDCGIMMICQDAASAESTNADDEVLCRDVERECGADDDVAGVLSFYFRGEVLPYYGGSVSRARSIKGCNHMLYWELMRRSVDQGVLGFDFGRSKAETGPFSFKKNFGFTPQPLPYEYHLVRDSALPDLNPSNPSYQRLIRVWQRLPLPVANAMGPLVAGSLG